MHLYLPLPLCSPPGTGTGAGSPGTSISCLVCTQCLPVTHHNGTHRWQVTGTDGAVWGASADVEGGGVDVRGRKHAGSDPWGTAE